ncbi:MAG: efflux RND transporter permease subunit [Deltaproteobacteria bacterium]|nr:efflux RND transporter permease subunit [Deltaproteobacteria bacterium]
MSAEPVPGGPISWMARNPVAANLVMISLIVGGLMMSFRIRKEVFPEVDLDTVLIQIPYPGASPAEVEQGVLLAVEEAVRPLDGVKRVEASAVEGLASVEVELETGTDRNKALTDVKNAVDRITSFPQEIERPVVNLPELKAHAISLVLYGRQEEKVLFELGEQMRDELLGLSEISYVEVYGTRPLEIAVEVEAETLRRYELSLPMIADQIRRTALDLPAGGVKTAGGEVLLRTTERRDAGREFADIPVARAADGSPVPLGRIAKIEDGFAETEIEARFDGLPAVMIQIYSVGDQSPTDVADVVKAFAARKKGSLPPGLSITTYNDMSKLYAQRLDLLMRNAAIGLVLVLLILGFFLEPKLAFWVTMGIPISFLGSLLLLPALGVSINMLSLFAFIVTLGMVVDDAIVVGENTFRFRREGHGLLRAAILGTRQVATPVFFSVATTLAAFSPLLFVPGTRGKVWFCIPVVVISVLSLSLFESFFVLPAHLAHARPSSSRGVFGFLVRAQGRFSRGVERFVDRVYLPIIRWCIGQRWINLALCIAVFLLSVGLVAGGRVKNIDFPKEESDWVTAEARLPFGVAVEETRQVMDRMVQAAKQVIAANGGDRISLGIFSMVGVTFGRHRRTQNTGGHVTSVHVTLVETDERDISSVEFASQWRRAVGEIPGIESLSFDSTTGRTTKPIDIELAHRDMRELEAASRDLAAQLAGFQGLKDIDNGIELGKSQLDFTLTAEGLAAGLSSSDVASQVRSAFYGAEAFRQQRGRHELKVMVRLPRGERETLHSVDELRIRTAGGGEMPLRLAARVAPGRSYTSIVRTDGKRTLRVQADVEEGRANAQEVMRAVFGRIVPELVAAHPGLSLASAGRQKDIREFYDFMFFGFAVALLVMFTLMAVPLRSYAQPLFVVMAAIPFGFTGAVLGHLVMGMHLSMISIMGIVALSGVVVNDSLVYVSAANRFRRQGLSPEQAARAACKQRFRPITLTSLTTFAGLAPMIFETSVQARLMIPMAVSLGFGIIFSTSIVLLLVPGLFVMVEHARGALGGFRAWLSGRAREDDLPDGGHGALP